MSFLARSPPIRFINQAARSPYALRTFIASSTQQKSVVDTTKDVLKTVDRKVSDKLVDGFEVAQREIKDSSEASRAFTSAINSAVGETVTKKTKEITGMENAGSKAKGAMYEAEGSAENLTGQASGKASEIAGKAKGKAAEIGGDLKGKANEVEGAAKGRSAELQGASGTAKPGVKGM